MLDRFQEVPYEGPMCDLMWGDPDPDNSGFRVSSRGAGYTFGKDVVDKFMAVNDLNYIVRAHQLCQDGFQVLWDKFATIWSAPNYCYRMGNLATILEIAEDGVCTTVPLYTTAVTGGMAAAILLCCCAYIVSCVGCVSCLCVVWSRVNIITYSLKHRPRTEKH